MVPEEYLSLAMMASRVASKVSVEYLKGFEIPLEALEAAEAEAVGVVLQLEAAEAAVEIEEAVELVVVELEHWEHLRLAPELEHWELVESHCHWSPS